MKFYLPCIFICLVLFSSCNNKDGGLNFFSIDDDIRYGEEMSQQIRDDQANFELIDEKDYPKAYFYVQQITKAILKSKSIHHRDDFPWKITLIKNDTILNAFCTPGGNIFIYSGLIKYLSNEDELAGVLGHEIAHADLRHSTEQLTKNYGIRLVLHFFLGNHNILGNIGENLLSLNFSRADETSADLQSVKYLCDTEYDPRGVARFFEKLEQQGETSGGLVFLDTHPNPKNRKENIYKEWKKLGSKQGMLFADRYNDLKASLP